jgi:glycine/D-amino acid oxidase-like deaminating enzyme
MHDVLIVGNGVLGLSLGVELTRRGTHVAVVGEPARPWAATAAAGAMNGCFGEVTASLLSSEDGRAKLDLDVRATALWDEWLDSLSADGDAAIRTAKSTIVMLNTVGVPDVDTANYTAIRQALVEYGEHFEDIDPADIDWLDPEPTSRPLRAMYLPGEGAVDAAALLARLEAAFERGAGTLVGELATAVRHSRDGVQGVVLASGRRLSAPIVVLAAGARSHELLGCVPEAARRIPPMVSGYGVSALVDTEDGSIPTSVIRTPNRAFACGLHVVPRTAGTVYVGATNIVSEQPRTTALLCDVQFLLGCTDRQVRRDLSEGGLRRLQVGNRPVPLDGFPLLGEAAPGLWMMTGTYRDGLHQSPLLAREMARRVLGEEPELDLERFSPIRVPIQPMTRAEVVAATVTHMLATGYEYDWSLPIEWPLRMERHLRRWYTQVAEELDPEYTPPPELLAAMTPGLERALRGYYAASRESFVGV